MKPSKLIQLVIVAAVLVALAFGTRRHSNPPSILGKKLLPNLALASVGRVEIARSGAPLVIVREDESWAITNLFGYPADVTKLQTALLKLTELKIGDVARGMNIDTNATLVDLQGASGRPLATLRLGSRPAATEPRPGVRPPLGRYVSVAGDPQVYLVKEELSEFDGEPRDWANSQLLSLTSADIQAITLTNPTGAVLSLLREGNALQLQGLTTNEEFDTGKSYSVESALSYLSFTGVADPKLDDAKTGLAAPGIYRMKMKNGDLYTARVGSASINGDRYLRLEAALAPPGTNATAQAEQTTRQAEMDQKFGKWTYLVSASTAESLTLSRAELVKTRTVVTNTTTSADAPVAQ